MQMWREPFLQLSLIWMDVVGKYVEHLVPVLLQRDQWQVTSVVLEDSSQSRPASTVLPMSRIQCITRSDRSAFTPVRCTSESDLREQKVQQEGVSASNPHLSSFTDKVSSDESSGSDESSFSWRPVRMTASPPHKTGFKGKTIVTAAQIHVPCVKDDDSDKTNDIQDLSFEKHKEFAESSLEQTQRIEDIDKDDDNSGLSHVVRHVLPNHTECEEGGILQQDMSISAGKTSKQNSSEIVKPALTSLTGLYDEQRATPYENDEKEANEGSSPNLGSSGDSLSYNTARSSLSEGSGSVIKDESDITEDESIRSFSEESVLTQISGEKLNGSVVDTLDQSLKDATIRPIQSVEGAQTLTFSETSELHSVESGQPPSTSNTPVLQSVEGTQNTLPNVEGVPNLSKEVTETNVSVSTQNIAGIETTPARQDEACELKGKTSCQECPHKAVIMPTDIEHIADPPAVTRTTMSTGDPSDQPSDESGPVPIVNGQSLAVPKNKLLSRTIAADKASLSSVPTEYGSCPTSYATARESSRSTDDVSSEYDSASSSTDYGSCSDSDSEPSGMEPPPAPQVPTIDTSKTEIVPVSSSMVDLLCCVQRLTSFACHLCKVLCPTERVIPGSEGQVEMEENKARTMEIKTALCGKLIKIVKRIITLYVDDILAIETCGISEDDMISVIGQNMTRHLIGRYRSGEVIGCRFNPGRMERCNIRNNAGKKVKPCPALCKVRESPTGCELTAEKMGLRISDVIILQSLLSWLHDRLTTAISRFDSMPGFHGEFDRQSILSESYCQNGPTLDGSGQGFQQDSRRNGEEEYLRLAQSLDVSLDECSADLEGNLNAQDKLIAYRVNDIFKKILHELLSLSLPSFSVRRRLQPAVDFLRRRLTAMRRVMLPDRFVLLIRRLWRHITQDFEEEVELLKERRPGALEHAGLLLMSIAHLMQFFHNQKQGLGSEELNVTTETVSKLIELYTSSTLELIRLYRWLRQQMISLEQEQTADEFTSSVSTSSHHSGIQSPADHLVETLRSELHAINKCFSGAVFVEWVKNYVQNNGYDSLGVCIGINETETAIELGQYLLEKNLLVCVRNTEVTESMVPDNEADLEQPASRLLQQRMSRSSRGAVVMDETSLPKMTVNKISVDKHNSSSSRPNSSQSTSQHSTETSDLSDSEESDTQGLLDSVDAVLRQARSTLSIALLFYNSPNVFYSFISYEEGSGAEQKYKLAFIDRFSIGVKLQHIVRALYTRKNDETARFFLKRLPINEVVYALGYKETPICFSI